MKLISPKLLLIFLILFISWLDATGASVVFDDISDFTANTISSSDTEITSSGIGIRSYDIPSDFRNQVDYVSPLMYPIYTAPTEHSVSTNLPPSSPYTQSRKVVSYDLMAGTAFSAIIMFFGADSAIIQPTEVTWYEKAPYHNSGDQAVGGFYYVFCNTLNAPVLGHYDKGFALPSLMFTGVSLDTHFPYGAGELNFWGWEYEDLVNSCDSLGTSHQKQLTWSVPKTTWGQAQIHNKWIKYKEEFDWTNKLQRLSLNDALQTSLRRSDCYEPETVSGGWIDMYKINLSGYQIPQNGPDLSSLDDYISYDRVIFYVERLDFSVTADPNFSGPIITYVASSYNKWRIKSANTVLDIPTAGLGVTIPSAYLSWTTNDTTDSTLNFLASRSYAIPGDCTITTSSEVSGHPGSDAINYTGTYHDIKDEDSYWQGASTSEWWRCDFGSTPRVISWIELDPYFSNIETAKTGDDIISAITVQGITVKASQDAQSWTTLYTGTYDTSKFFNDITYVNNTAYRYYQLDLTHPTLHPGLWSIRLRDGNTRAASAWTQKIVECRTSSDGGSTYGSWHVMSNGDTIPDVTFPISSSNLRVQARVTLNTDAQKYQPVLTSLTLSDEPISDSSPPVSSGWNPAKSATGVSRSSNIVVHVTDAGDGVDQSTIVMTVEGSTVTPQITGTPTDYTLTYDPPSDFSYGQVVDVTVDAEDLAGNAMSQDSYSFTIESEPATGTEINILSGALLSGGSAQ